MEFFEYNLRNILIASFMLYLYMYFKGKTINTQKSEIWFSRARFCLQQKFQNINPSIIHESSTLYSIACTDYPGVLYCLGKLELIRRQDLITRVVSSFWSKMQDTVCYEIPIPNLSRKELVFGIINRSLKHKIEFYDDLVRLGKSELLTDFLFLSSDKSLQDKILRPDQMACFKSCMKSLKLLYVSSEIQIVSNSNLLIRATFNYDERQIEPQINFVLAITSRILHLIE